MFKSVFDSLTGVKEAIDSGRIDSSNVVVNIDKGSVGVFLHMDGDYFEGYEDEEYYMSPGGEHERQCLFYSRFNRPEELLVEVLGEFLGDGTSQFESVNYRQDTTATNFV